MLIRLAKVWFLCLSVVSKLLYKQEDGHMFENAKWIRYKKPNTRYGYGLELPMPYIRKSFHIQKEVENITLNICALGYGVCYINGKPVTRDLLTTLISAYDKTVYYNEYDITNLVFTGENVIGVMLGNGWYNDSCENWGFVHATWRDMPKLLAEIKIIYTDGSVDTISSNSGWKMHAGPLVYNNARCGEVYDARLEIEGWNLPGFCEDDWDSSLVMNGPGGILKKNIIPPIRHIRTIKPVQLENGVYDLQENISGWVKFKVQGNAGDTVKVIYAERLHPDGTIDNENENALNKSLNRIQSDEYILKGGAPEEWEPMFTYHGFQYFVIEGNAKVLDVEGKLVHTDLQKVGDFECSDEILNKLHRASVQSTLTNYFGIPTDCPQREQNGWSGDAAISAEQSIMNFDMTSVYTKWMDDFRDAQRPDGQLPSVIPNPAGFGWNGGPAWDGAFILIPYYLYLYTGDKSLIEKHYNDFVKYMDFLNTLAEEDGLTSVALGDWAPPPKNYGRIDSRIVNNCYYHTLVVVMGKCATILGKDASYYEELAEKIKKSYQKNYISVKAPDTDTQSAIACAIYHGMYDEKDIPTAVAELVELIKENDNHFHTGILGTKAMFTVLSEHGYIDLLYKMVTNPTMPSYAYWINQGMTTLCEHWDMSASRNHHMFSEVDFWFYKYLAGIRICKDEIMIKPYFIENVKWVRCHHRDISVYWDEDKVVVHVPKKAQLILNNEKIELKPGKNIVERK